MFDFSSFDITVIQWAILSITAILVGISKTGIPGVGIIAVLLIAIAFDDAKASVGLLLPLLVFADIFAAGYYRRKARWNHIIRLIPWTLAGILAGFVGMHFINGEQLKPVIGSIVLVMLALKYWQGLKKQNDVEIDLPSHWAFAAVLGFFTGLTTMMANAAGPIMILYLLAMKLPKTEFVGTAAWFFFIVNWIKVPFMAELGLINQQSLKLNVILLPIVAAGAITGIFLLRHIPQKIFNKAMLILAAAAAIKLIFG